MRRAPSASLLTLVVMLLCAWTWIARAQSLFEKLVMPGELVQGHAKLEKDCGNCHTAFSRQSQSSKCLDCHKDIAADRQRQRGFHGLSGQASKGECRSCHGDHKGRGADIVGLDRETFNHTFTDFKLVGAHATASCSACHATGVKFSKAPTRCIDCHKSIDPHKGDLGDKCDTCHSATEAWRKTRPFDHGKTQFPLTDAHAKVACAACHAGEKYKALPTTCVSCHRIQDAHAGRYGDKCQFCHGPAKWRETRFDHGKTRFALEGRHASVKCDACHVGNLSDKLGTTCVSCHRAADPHKGQLGSKCESCHKPAGWRTKTAFDHDLSRFPLIGLHAAVPCDECHHSQSYKSTPRECSTCHKDTRHAGRLGPRCESCHNPNGWALWRFDHDKRTKFSLSGAHRGLECGACHTRVVVAGGKATAPTECIGCHANDDVHQGSFGRSCEKCHASDRFRAVRPQR